MKKPNVETSKFLSYILRHEPESIGLTLDSEGWADINDLIQLANTSGNNITLEKIHSIVENDKKGRFSVASDGQCIRAVQGHSLQSVDLKLEETTPPASLFHGTAQRFIESINAEGLISKDRQYVHLTADYETAVKTGMRYGRPVVLNIDSQKMQEYGCKFYQAENNVWLTLAVPPAYINVYK